MELKTKAEGMMQVFSNFSKIDRIKKEKPTKLNRLAMYMLGGRPVTGAIMIAKFDIYSYRDAIYKLTQKGYDISSDTIIKNGIGHKIWWLSEFSEDFVKSREESIF